MAARKSLRAVSAAETAGKAEEAAKVARALSGAQAAPSAPPDGEPEAMETISYNLPDELVDLVRELAEERVRWARAEKRRAKREGRKGPEARMSASAVVREALEAQRGAIEAEIAELRG